MMTSFLTFARLTAYIDNGLRLGWLIDPHEPQVIVYHPDETPKHFTNIPALSGDPILPNFTLDLTLIWQEP